MTIDIELVAAKFMKKVFSFSGVVDMEMIDLQIGCSQQGDVNSPRLMWPKSTTNYKALTDTAVTALQ